MIIKKTGFQQVPVVSRRLAFTLIELLVSVGIMMLLLALLIPVLRQAHDSATRVSCLGNERALTQAWITYAHAHDEQLAIADPQPGGWVSTNNVVADITVGTLYPYLHSVTAFRCPGDPNRILARSYSINCMLNGQNYGNTPWTHFGQIAHPSNTFVFIEEYDPRGFNMGSWAIYPTGSQWVDMPGVYHGFSSASARGGAGSCLSFADGHAEYWQWADLQTLAMSNFFAVTPNDPDLTRLQKAKVGNY
jgi:type II secretory pathway pseudopilin PulG